MDVTALLRTNLDRVTTQFMAQTCYYAKPKEANVTRGQDRDIKGRKNAAANPTVWIPITAARIYLSPGQKQRERAGVKENVNAIVFVLEPHFYEKIGPKPADIIRHRIQLKNFGGIVQRSYVIDQAHNKGMLSDGYAYVVLGLVEEV